jgi:hypothetical protein
LPVAVDNVVSMYVQVESHVSKLLGILFFVVLSMFYASDFYTQFVANVLFRDEFLMIVGILRGQRGSINTHSNA